MSNGSDNRPTGGLSVLVAASEFDTLEQLGGLLASCGCEVQSVGDGRAALEALQQTRPRLMLIDLLLPSLDGFEVCQSLRRNLGDNDVAIICMSAVPWGGVNLRNVLARRFNASLLPKPFTSGDLLRQLRATLGPEAVSDREPAARPIGVEEVVAISGLVEEYEREVARIAPDPARSRARLRHQYQADVGSQDEGFTAPTQDISPGGFFVRTYTPPQPNDLVEVTLQLAGSQRTVRAQARVVHQVSPEKAKLYGAAPGFGVEFVDLDAEDAALLDGLLRASVEDVNEGEDVPGDEDHAPLTGGQGRTWIVLLGLSAKDLRARPNFLQRTNIGLVAFPDLESAEDFLRTNPIAACVIGDEALGEDTQQRFLRIARLAGGDAKRLAVTRRAEVSELLASGRCDAAFDPDAGLDVVIDDLQRRLGIPHRSSPRVRHEATVHIRAPRREAEGRLLQVNCGGLLMRVRAPLSVGTKVQIELSLPDTPPIRGDGLVLRCSRPRDAEAHLVGVAFASFAEGDESRLQTYVRGHVSFRDLFTWLKHHHFGAATD